MRAVPLWRCLLVGPPPLPVVRRRSFRFFWWHLHSWALRKARPGLTSTVSGCLVWGWGWGCVRACMCVRIRVCMCVVRVCVLCMCVCEHVYVWVDGWVCARARAHVCMLYTPYCLWRAFLSRLITSWLKVDSADLTKTQGFRVCTYVTISLARVSECSRGANYCCFMYRKGQALKIHFRWEMGLSQDCVHPALQQGDSLSRSCVHHQTSTDMH